MSGAIPMREWVVSGLVSEGTVNALLRFGEPMLTDRYPYRAFLRRRAGGRTMGPPDLTPQLAAEGLLRKLRGGR